MARGLLVVAVTMSGATCRIADLISVKSALLKVVPALPDSLKASSALGSTAPQIRPIDVINDGGGSLEWRASLKHNSSWVTLDPDTGTAGQTPTLQAVFHPSGLDVGVYEDTVVVEDRGGTGTLEVPLWYWVRPCDLTAIALPDSDSSILTSADCGAPHRQGRFARVYQINNGTSVDSVTIEVTAAYDAYVVFDTALAGTAPPLKQSDNCLGAGSDPCLYYIKLPRDGVPYYVEVTSADSADTGAFKVRVLRPRPPTAPDSLDQREPADSTTPVVPGGVLSQQSILLRAVASDPDLGDTLQLQAEVQPAAINFTGFANWFGGKVPNGSPAYVLVTGLTDNTSYHWRVRAADQTGRTSSNWKAFSADPAFNVQSGHDPNPPSPNQYQSDGATVIAVGGNANQPTVIFKALVSDPDAADSLSLDVEVEPLGTGFDSTATASSVRVANGGTATVTIAAPDLVAGQDYHWQARVLDNHGRQTGWASFGNNAESAADFHVNASPTQLVWLTQPGNSIAGSAIPGTPSGSPKVAVQDQNGNTITTFNGSVTMAIKSKPNGGQATLLGNVTANASNGVATFTNLIVDTAGTGYTLQATAQTGTGSIQSAESLPFTVAAAAVTQVVFTQQPPSSAVAGATFTAKVSGEDQFGNVNTSFTNSVTVAIANNPGNPPGTLGGTIPISAVSGTATFSNLTINKSGNGYTLRASSGTLTPDTSLGFNITPGPPTHLAYTVQPSTAQAGNPITPAIQVVARDAFDNLATSFTGNVTLAITPATDTSGGTLSGGGPLAATAGTVSFPNASIDKTGSGYTLTAAASNLTSAVSATFDITNTQISEGNSRVAVSSSTITASTGSSSTTITVTARDVLNNTVAGATVNLSVTNTNNGNSLNPNTTQLQTNSSGQAIWTFSSTVAEVKTVTAIINGITVTTQPTITVNPGAPTALEFTTSIGNTTAGLAINAATGVIVRARDQFTNTATSFTGNVTMAIAAPAGGAFAPTSTNTATAASGIANFPNLRIYKAGTGYQLRASSGTLTVGLSNTFTINAAPPNKLAFTTQPTTTAVLARIDSAAGGVVVSVQDSVGNTVPFGGTVQVLMGTNPGSGTLTGGSAISAPTGIATFSNLRINAPGSGYTIVTTSSGPSLASDQSSPFDIVVGPAARLSFGQEPSNATAGTSISPAVTVKILDANGFQTSSTATVTLAIASGTGTNGAHLSGGSIAAVNGVATFGTLSIDSAGTGYKLTAASGTLTPDTSLSFSISAGNPSKLAFWQQPTNATAGASISPPVTVRILDALGNLTSSGASVTVAITSGTGTNGAHLSGATTVTQPASGGTATFSTLSIDSAGTGYTLTATSGSLTQATSTAFNITAGAATQLVFTKQPTSTTAGAIINQGSGGVVVTARDALGNKATSFNSNVSMAITSGTGTPGAKLGGTTSLTAVAGIATFSDLSINKSGSGYTLTAIATGPSSAVSTSFSITPGTATQLVITRQPASTAQSGVALIPQPVVQLEDASGNPVSQANVTVTASVATGPGASLTGANVNTDVNGTATFTSLTMSGTAGDYTLRFASGTLTPDTSATITLSAGPDAKLRFGQQPTSTTAGATISPAVTVQILDAAGNLTSSTANVTLAITSGTGTSGAHLSGGSTVTVAAMNGTATFPTLTIDSAGTNYTLSATSGTLPSVTSSAFNITAGTPAKLAFGQQPTSDTAGGNITPAVTVRILDANGNLTSSTANVTLAITSGTGTSGAHLSGGATVMVAAVNGTAMFSTLTIDSAGTNYTLTATSGALPSKTSSAFNITAGTAVELKFTAQPQSTSSGTVMSPIVLTAYDALGNVATGFGGNVTLVITTGTPLTGGPGNLNGTTTKAASAGVVTFSNLSITGVGTGYTLDATSTLPTVTSAPFDIN